MNEKISVNYEACKQNASVQRVTDSRGVRMRMKRM